MIINRNSDDPVAKTPIPESMMRWALQATEEVVGKQGMAVVLREAKLEKFIDNYPPEETKVTGACIAEQYSNLNAALLGFFGRAGRSMVIRIGRASQRYGVQRYGNLVGAAALAGLKLVPEDKKVAMNLQILKMVWDRMYQGSNLPSLDLRIEDRGDKMAYHNGSCATCAGKQTDEHMCYLGVGFLIEDMFWVSGKEYEVAEVACRAQGAPACVWEISKRPKE